MIWGIPDLMQHLWDAHLQQPYCPICHATFSTTKSCDEHVRIRQCSRRSATWTKGITHGQMQPLIEVEQLSEELYAWVTQDVQWLLVWCVLFPGEELLLRPYLSTKFESLICAVRHFWWDNGQGITLDFLKKRNLPCRMVPVEEHSLLAVLQAVLGRMLDQLVKGHAREVRGEMNGSDQAARVLAVWEVASSE